MWNCSVNFFLKWLKVNIFINNKKQTIFYNYALDCTNHKFAAKKIETPVSDFFQGFTALVVFFFSIRVKRVMIFVEISFVHYISSTKIPNCS